MIIGAKRKKRTPNMDYDHLAWMFDNFDEFRFGKRPRGTKKEETTVREIKLSEQIGLPVKIAKTNA